MQLPMSRIDLATRVFWRARGRKVDLAGTHKWLSGIKTNSSTVGATWVDEAAREVRGVVQNDRSDAGLLADMSTLDGPRFDSTQLHPAVRSFYEQTTRWRMEVWAEWNSLFQPAGQMIAHYFGRRVQQLAIPTRPLDVARGMESEVAVIADANGKQVAAAWIRKLRATGEFVYSGCYRTQRLPGTHQPSVHVTFPLEDGNIQVFLQPAVGAGGSLLLGSKRGVFGDNGAYIVVVDDQHGAHAMRVPLHEAFRVFVDSEGVLRTDHLLRLGRANVVRLHYRMTPER